MTTKAGAKLRLAMLIAEFGDGHYEPVAAVGSLGEAHALAGSDLRARTNDLERGGEPACPQRYVVWAPGTDGSYRRVKEIMP